MARLKLIEMDTDNRLIYFRKDDKLIAFDADVAIELISDSLDGKYVDLVRCKECKNLDLVRCKDCKWWKTKYMRNGKRKVCVIEAYEPVRNEDEYCSWGERKENAETD